MECERESERVCERVYERKVEIACVYVFKKEKEKCRECEKRGNVRERERTCVTEKESV